MDATVTSNNSSTGSDSTNTTAVSLSNSTSSVVNTNSSTTNSTDFVVDTGQNTVTGNTSVGPVTTGSSDLGWDVQTTDNGFTATAPLPSGGTVNVQSSNTDTGSGSSNTTTVTNNQVTQTRVSNSSVVHSSFAANVVTGGNVLNANTKAAGLTTGNVSIHIAVATTANAVPVTTPSPSPVITSTPLPTSTGSQSSPSSLVPLGWLGKGSGLPVNVVLASAPVSSSATGGYFPSGASLSIEVPVLLVLAGMTAYLLPIVAKAVQQVKAGVLYV